MMFGDSVTSDIEGGLRYGMKTCLYRRNKKMSVPENVIVVDTLREFVDMKK